MQELIGCCRKPCQGGLTCGKREMWVLPPSAAHEALPDVRCESGAFSDYCPWEDDARHAAWRCVELAVGDWVFMPRGWWHVVASSAGSVMLNFRV